MKYKEMKLGDVAEINMGQSPNSKYYNSDRKGIEFLQGVLKIIPPSIRTQLNITKFQKREIFYLVFVHLLEK